MEIGSIQANLLSVPGKKFNIATNASSIPLGKDSAMISSFINQ